MEAYNKLCAEAQNDYEGFWARLAKENIHWKNELIMRYGINKQESQEVRKTDDQFAFNSTFGYKRDTISNWYYAGKFNFNTHWFRDFILNSPRVISPTV